MRTRAPFEVRYALFVLVGDEPHERIQTCQRLERLGDLVKLVPMLGKPVSVLHLNFRDLLD